MKKKSLRPGKIQAVVIEALEECGRERSTELPNFIDYMVQDRDPNYQAFFHTQLLQKGKKQQNKTPQVQSPW